MKLHSLIVATFVLLALAGTLYWSEHRKPPQAKVSADTPPAILKLDEAALSKLEIKKNDEEPIVLVKNGSGNWQITQPKLLNADQSTVTNTLSSLSSLNAERVVDDKPADLKQFGLAPPSIEIDLASKDNKTHQLLIGDDTPAGAALYAKLAGDPRVFTIASYNKNNIDKSLNDLRDKRLLTVSADKVVRLELIEHSQEIEFGRNKDEWQILKPKPMRTDSVQVGDLVSKLADARMDPSGLDDPAKKDAAAFAQSIPVATAKITGPSTTEELQVRKNKDVYYAKSSVVDGIYKIDASLGQALAKRLEDFRTKKLFDFGYSEPNKIEMHDGSKGYFLSKGGNDWWSNGKKMDVGEVQEFISDLRNLSASKFVDSGFTNPAIELTVTSDEGKRVENVSIAKSGDGFIAKRENDRTLYFIASEPVDALEKAADAIKAATPNGK